MNSRENSVPPEISRENEAQPETPETSRSCQSKFKENQEESESESDIDAYFDVPLDTIKLICDRRVKDDVIYYLCLMSSNTYVWIPGLSLGKNCRELIRDYHTRQLCFKKILSNEMKCLLDKEPIEGEKKKDKSYLDFKGFMNYSIEPIDSKTTADLDKHKYLGQVELCEPGYTPDDTPIPHVSRVRDIFLKKDENSSDSLRLEFFERPTGPKRKEMFYPFW